MDRRPVTGAAQILRADSRSLPLADDTVDLIVTSPPYFGLRSYQDGGEHYAGQIGDEPTPAEFIDALIEVTAECMRVLKQSGSLWVNLGDKYAVRWASVRDEGRAGLGGPSAGRRRSGANNTGAREKSLIGLPWRYAIRCIDELGLILRAEVIWSKPNGLPESVTDRVRRSHETWFHFTLQPRYYSAVDEIRETHARSWGDGPNGGHAHRKAQAGVNAESNLDRSAPNPLGKLPGSVWEIATEPLIVPEHLGVDHFAAFPTEWPRRIIAGWSPAGVCVDCGEGRRPASEKTLTPDAQGRTGRHGGRRADAPLAGPARAMLNGLSVREITGHACACPEPTAATRPGVVLDPFGGTGTTALVAKALGRHGISVDMSADYCRLAEWRTNDPAQLAKAARRPHKPSKKFGEAQTDLLTMLTEEHPA